MSGAVDRTKPREVRHYRCTCGEPVTVEFWNGWGYAPDAYVYRVNDQVVCACPNCERTLRMSWLGQRPRQGVAP